MKLCHLQEKWIELKIIMLSEISQTKKDKYHMLSLLYVEPKPGKKKKKRMTRV
jgi:hypothetical protein